MAGMDTSEERQDEDFPRLVSERLAMDGYLHEEEDSPEREQTREQDVHSMDAHSTKRHKRKLQASDFSLSLDQSECAVLSDVETPDDLDFDVDDLDTPNEAESIDYAHSTELEWENVHSMDAHSTKRHKRKLQAPDFSLSQDQSECSVLSDAETPDDLDFDVADLDTPDEAESIDYAHRTELEWESKSITCHGEMPFTHSNATTCFHAHVRALLEVLRPINPYRERSPHLSTWHTKVVMDAAVVNSMCEWRNLGKMLYKDYAQTRFKDGSKAITDTIHRNKLSIFQKPPDKPKRENQTLKQNAALVAQLFLSIQSRPEADLGEFFQFENQKEPPSLANNAGNLRIGTKSDLLKCLPQTMSDKPAGVTVRIYDGPAIVHTRACPYYIYI
uniref:uncharacterized protein n=1 Tax=Myxine glutinosa TaxID=7769 RepID=UPI00358E8E01